VFRSVLAGGAAGLLLVVVVRLVHIFILDNVHTVLPGLVYRSAQLSPAQLEQVLDRYRIRTVVNLRGYCPGFDWYLGESRVTHDRGVAQEDVCLSSGRMPSTGEVRRLVDVIDRSEYPIIFHCHRGIDRTGLAAAMTLLLRTETPLDEARTQLGLRYAHLAFGKTGLLDRFLDLYGEWLAERGAGHAPDTFRRWAREEYRPGECWARLELMDPLPRIAAEEPAGLRVRVTNTSPRPWRLQSNRIAGIHLRFAVLDREGVCLGAGHAGLFDAVVRPGESLELTLALPPLPAGRHHLLVDMEEAGHCLFAQAGSEPLEEELIVGE
jgi:hypothetical protein